MSTQKPFDPNAYEKLVSEPKSIVPVPGSFNDLVAQMLEQGSSQQVTVANVPISENQAFQELTESHLQSEIRAGNKAAAALSDIWERLEKASGQKISNQAEAYVVIDELAQCNNDYMNLLDGLEKLIKG